MEIRCPLTYHPQLDRLFGGDMVREFQGVPVKICLMSQRRAKALISLSKELGKAYDAVVTADWRKDPPFPQVLFVLDPGGVPVSIDGREQLMSPEDLFGLGLLPLAPEEYQELAQVVTGPYAPFAGASTLRSKQLPEIGSLLALARRLFTIIRCGHGIGAAFSRGSGSCIQVGCVTPSGAITDLYYLTRESLTQEVIRQEQKRDLMRGFGLLKRANTWGTKALETAFGEAFQAYAGGVTVAPTLHNLAVVTIQQSEDLAHAADVDALLEALADAVQHSHPLS